MSPRGSTTNSSHGINGRIEERQAVPARANHLPNHLERVALQKLRTGRELSLRDLEPTSRTTILRLTNKGWIERGLAIGTYRITSLGEHAVRAQLPLQIKPQQTNS
jgi:hypothetical protein